VNVSRHSYIIVPLVCDAQGLHHPLIATHRASLGALFDRAVQEIRFAIEAHNFQFSFETTGDAPYIDGPLQDSILDIVGDMFPLGATQELQTRTRNRERATQKDHVEEKEPFRAETQPSLIPPVGSCNLCGESLSMRCRATGKPHSSTLCVVCKKEINPRLPFCTRAEVDEFKCTTDLDMATRFGAIRTSTKSSRQHTSGDYGGSNEDLSVPKKSKHTFS